MYGSRKLTPTEWKVVVLVAWGLKNREIGIELGTTQFVIRNYLKSIFRKTGMATRLELSIWYIKHLEFVRKT